MNSNIPNKSITIEQLNLMFDNMAETWDVDKPLLWGYFFTHHETTLLEKAKDLLIAKGYTFVNIHLSEKEKEKKTDPDMYWLHVEKTEKHTPETLDKRNDELYLFANELGIDSYDGMDVGLVN